YRVARVRIVDGENLGVRVPAAELDVLCREDIAVLAARHVQRRDLQRGGLRLFGAVEFAGVDRGMGGGIGRDLQLCLRGDAVAEVEREAAEDERGHEDLKAQGGDAALLTREEAEDGGGDFRGDHGSV